MVSQIKGIQNPQALMNQMPQYKQVMDYVNANGGDAKSAFYKMAKEMGIDPDEVLMMMK